MGDGRVADRRTGGGADGGERARVHECAHAAGGVVEDERARGEAAAVREITGDRDDLDRGAVRRRARGHHERRVRGRRHAQARRHARVGEAREDAGH
jgi:hypothetical protein